MATTGGNRGRGRGGGPGNGGNRGGGADSRRGSWRAGPPGSVNYNSAAKMGTPTNVGPGNGTPPAGPKGPSINDHMKAMAITAEKEKGSPKIFQTDTEISNTANHNKQRELQRWQADPSIIDPGKTKNGENGNGNTVNGEVKQGGKGNVDAETFGPGQGGKWDQFETNSRLFGTKTSYQEELYTTKLNKGGADFKQREKEAEKLANEIMGQTSSNFHLQEERNASISWADDVDEEEKYSGVVRNPNAYVPPARRTGAVVGYAAAAGRPVTSAPLPPSQNAKPNGHVVLGGSKASPVNKATPAPKAPAPPSASSAPSARAADQADAPPAKKEGIVKQEEPTPTEDKTPAPLAEKPPAIASAVKEDGVAASASPQSSGAALKPVNTEQDSAAVPNVLGAYRQFVGDEMQRAEAKKQSAAKAEREKQLADLKKFQASFKVPLPMPKDILPILAKDEDKQKAIEAKAESSLQAARDAAKNPKSPEPTSSKKATPKKILMSIAEIPPFNPNKRKPSPSQNSGPLPISESARTDIQVKSPAAPPAELSKPANGEKDAQSAPAKNKLNPSASSFVFKPNANAPVFKPGQPSSPAASIGRVISPAGPSVPRNPFFDEMPERLNVDIRAEFNPFKSAGGQLPLASTIAPNWPYNGRPVAIDFRANGPMGFAGNGEEDGSTFRPPVGMPIQGMPPFMRPNQTPGMSQMNMQGGPMFSGNGPNGPLPGPNYIPGGYGQIPNGVPMNGFNQQFMGGPQGMFYPNPNGPPGQGPGQALGPGPNGMPIQNGPNGHVGQFIPHQHQQQQNGHGGFPGPGSPGSRGMMHHQPHPSMQGMMALGPGQGGGYGQFAQGQGPPGMQGMGPQGPPSGGPSSQHGGAQSQSSQLGTPHQTPQSELLFNVYDAG